MEIDDFQIPHLATFSRAAELGSFTSAALALGLTQAAVSQRISALEQSLGKSLFDRRGGRVSLTDAGRRLYDYAQQILELHIAARCDISSRIDCPISELVIAASSIPGEHLLPRMLDEFGRRHPQIRVRATVTDSADALAQVSRGSVQLALVGWRDKETKLEYRRIGADRMVLVVSHQHPWAKHKTVRLDRVLSEPLILRERGSGQRHFFADSLVRAGRSLDESQVMLELGSNEGIKEAVLRGLGVSVLSKSAVEEDVRKNRLHTLRIQGLDCRRDLFVVRDPRRVLPLAARLFRDHVSVPRLPAHSGRKLPH